MSKRYSSKHPYPGVSQRPSRRYRVQKPSHRGGKQITYGTYDHYEDAEAVAIEIHRRIRLGQGTADLAQPRIATAGALSACSSETARLADIVDRYMANREGRVRRKATLCHEFNVVRTHVLPAFTGEIRSITTNEIQAWVDRLILEDHYATGTVMEARSILFRMIEYWRRDAPGRLQRSPDNPARAGRDGGIVAARSTARRSAVTDPDLAAWTLEDYLRFRSFVPSRWRDIYDVLYMTGAREGGVAGLTVGAIDLDAQTVTIACQAGSGVSHPDADERGVIPGVKEDASVRKIRVAAQVTTILRRRIDVIPLEDRATEILVFRGRGGGLGILPTLRKIFQEAARAAGLWPDPIGQNGGDALEAKVTMHHLRASLISHVASQVVGHHGVTEGDLNAYVGHSLARGAREAGVNPTSRSRYQRRYGDPDAVIASAVQTDIGELIERDDRDPAQSYVLVSDAREAIGLSPARYDAELVKGGIEAVRLPGGGQRKYILASQADQIRACVQMPPEGYLEVAEVRRRLGWAKATVKKAVHSGTLRAKKVGHRWWCAEEDVTALSERRRFLTVAETARRLKRSESHVLELLASGRLVGSKVSGAWQITESSVRMEMRLRRAPRGYVSQTAAAKELGMKPERLRRLLEDPARELRERTALGRSWIQAESIAAERDRLQPPPGWLSAPELAERIGRDSMEISIACRLGLLRAKELPGHIKPSWYIDPESIDSYLHGSRECHAFRSPTWPCHIRRTTTIRAWRGSTPTSSVRALGRSHNEIGHVDGHGFQISVAGYQTRHDATVPAFSAGSCPAAIRETT